MNKQVPVAALPIDWSSEPKPLYANGAQVVHTMREFALLFTDMAAFPGRLASDGVAGHERATVVASLRVTPDVYFEMLCVLASNWNAFVNQLSDPRMVNHPRFKLVDAGELQLEGLDDAPGEEG